MPNYKVHYFDARGRGEIIRLLLTYAGQKFEDNRIGGEDWAKFKPSTPFGQMPVFQIDDKLYGQTTAIANYLAREFGLYGKTNLDAFEIDQVVCLIADFMSATVKAFMEKDEAKKEELMKKYTEEDVPKYVGFLEGLLKNNGSGFFVGAAVSLADLVVYDFIWGLNQRMAAALENYPLVKGHLERIGAVPQIKTYVDARKPTTF